MKPVGRPRAFDRDAALAQAMEVFWERGYEGTSLGDLTEAMGINRPSLYATFGNKQDLFAVALARYEAVEGATISRILNEQATALGAIEATLRHNARVYVAEGRPRGCMIVLSSLVGTPESDTVRALLAQRREAGKLEFLQRIERGKVEGDVDEALDAKRLAGFFSTVLHGMSIEARDGASQSELDAIVDVAMNSWPA